MGLELPKQGIKLPYGFSEILKLYLFNIRICKAYIVEQDKYTENYNWNDNNQDSDKTANKEIPYLCHCSILSGRMSGYINLKLDVRHLLFHDNSLFCPVARLFSALFPFLFFRTPGSGR
jgi:hypothetical protein